MIKLLETNWVAAPAAVTPFCHGSSILALPGGDLLAGWFGGTWEAKTDTGIWMSRRPAGGVGSAGTLDSAGAPGWDRPWLAVPPEGHAHGNAVLVREPAGRLFLFYFRNYGEWCTGGRSFFVISDDGGRTWSPERPLSERAGLLVKNKAWIAPSGAIVLPVYDEWNWDSGVAISHDRGETWTVSTPVGSGTGVDMIQGALVPDRQGGLHMFMRTRSGRIYDAISADEGQTWGEPFAISLENPNSGIDAMGLPDGRMLMVYNPSRKIARDILSPEERNYRYPLCVGVSEDDGATWVNVLTLESEPGEYSYPAIIQAPDGTIHVTYTYQRQGIRHVVLGLV